ncbi:hypothetical protein GKZ90_0010275 [Flavobacterium sp. MC2016-06]|jgi:hypothetical protein|uniref:hypothetical protein n=1 Tax=Flavobacterium sp. MC2016-06 TaxID=2676308 RepID=UPI0012BAE5A9|nr:hypothetical protein [Flavobacterium sp. MC2016-06]MBU3858485.1 hypothetical protein [Flavobacterium sp. MC2016-06]
MSKIIKIIQEFFENSTLEKTKKSVVFLNKEYNGKVKIKIAVKSNLNLLFLSLIPLPFLILNFEDVRYKLLSSLLCFLLILYPLYLLFKTKPELIITAEGIAFSDSELLKWGKIKDTFIETIEPNDIATTYELVLEMKTGEVKKINIQDFTYSVEEISHIIEYFKDQKTI